MRLTDHSAVCLLGFSTPLAYFEPGVGGYHGARGPWDTARTPDLLWAFLQILVFQLCAPVSPPDKWGCQSLPPFLHLQCSWDPWELQRLRRGGGLISLCPSLPHLLVLLVLASPVTILPPRHLGTRFPVIPIMTSVCL